MILNGSLYMTRPHRRDGSAVRYADNQLEATGLTYTLSYPNLNLNLNPNQVRHADNQLEATLGEVCGPCLRVPASSLHLTFLPLPLPYASPCLCRCGTSCATLRSRRCPIWRC